MEHLGAAISRSKARLGDLRARRACVRHSYDVNKAILAPVRRITSGNSRGYPYSLPSAPSLVHLYQRSTASPPAGVSQIAAHRYRHAAFVDRVPASILVWAFLPMWLINCGILPIDLTMHHNTHKAAQLLAKSFHRFPRFSGELGSNLNKELSRQNHPIHAPSLESFELSFSADSIIPISHLKGCINVPQLAKLGLQDTSMMDLISFDPLLLRSVTLDDQDYARQMALQSLDFLTSCCNISF